MRGRARWVRWQPTNQAVWTPWHYSPGVRTACELWAPRRVGAIETAEAPPPGHRLCPGCERKIAWLSRLESRGQPATLPEGDARATRPNRL